MERIPVIGKKGHRREKSQYDRTVYINKSAPEMHTGRV